MSKFICLCGHEIVDQTDDLLYKAYYFPDEDYGVWFDKMVEALEAFVRKRESGKEVTLLDRPLSVIYPPAREVWGFINDAIWSSLMAAKRRIYECGVCGRIWLQINRDRQEYVSYWPETENRGVLSAQGAQLEVEPDAEP